ncbi:MAG: 4-alpha-glucanotransferase, partial [Verrucomicrobiota bacterium]
MQILRQLAAQLGIQTGHLDMAGHRQEASPDTLKALLKLDGIQADNARDCREALLELTQQHWRKCLEPAIVVWDGKPTPVELRLPANNQSSRCRLHLENGDSKRLKCDRLRLLKEVKLGSAQFVARQLILPALPPGYHKLEFETDGGTFHSLIISAPVKSYSPHGAQLSTAVRGEKPARRNAGFIRQSEMPHG